ncbi:MAG: PAS domain S-box protein [Chloroflexi bacterium]|nr:PAS domain S-box protein [Chloroflexota bacterium]
MTDTRSEMDGLLLRLNVARIVLAEEEEEEEEEAHTVVSLLDVTEQKRAEEALARESNLLRAVIDNTPDFIFVKDAESRFVLNNAAHMRGLRASSQEELLGKTDFDIFTQELAAQYYADEQAVAQSGQPLVNREEPYVDEAGNPKWLLTSKIALRDGSGSVVGLLGISRDITQRRQAEEERRKLSSAVEQTADNVFITDRDGLIEYVNPAFEKLTGYSKDEAIGQTPRILKSGEHVPEFYEKMWQTILAGKVFRATLKNRKKSGELYYEEKTITPLKDAQGNITHFVSTGKDITERVRAEAEIRRRAEELEALAQVSSALRQARTREAMLPLLVESAMEVFRADAGALLLLEEGMLVFAAARGSGESLAGRRYPPDDDPLWQVARTGEPLFVPDVSRHSEFDRWEICRSLMAGLAACACVPLKTAETTVGLLHLASRLRREPTEEERRLLTAIAEMAGSALHRAALHEQTEQRLQRLTALRTIDTAISASLDLRLTLNILLDQVTAQLGVDAAAVLLYNPLMQTLEFAAERGFRHKAVAQMRFRLGESNAGRAALERRIVSLPDMSEALDTFTYAQTLRVESFVAYYGVPLVAKGQVKGVLEIFHRAPIHPDPEWLDFLESLAAQAAIAIDNAQLFDNLQRSNVDLALAYDATIEGWSRALDLRDRETEGHTRRVTEITMRLAKAMGIGEVELVHIRRGALLHDIGKMGVPDDILHKPGKLTDDEWTVMRLHPQLAYDMLAPFAYLRPALDIPYCHHEKWDGTGYPRGLKDAQIPLAARLFAVVDVWDALISDRPYRAAWPEEKVIEHIKAGSGTHFDPKVVEVFITVIGEKV